MLRTGGRDPDDRNVWFLDSGRMFILMHSLYADVTVMNSRCVMISLQREITGHPNARKKTPFCPLTYPSMGMFSSVFACSQALMQLSLKTEKFRSRTKKNMFTPRMPNNMPWYAKIAQMPARVYPNRNLDAAVLPGSTFLNGPFMSHETSSKIFFHARLPCRLWQTPQHA